MAGDTPVRGTATCPDVRCDMQSCTSGLRSHFPSSRPWNPHNCSHAGSPHAELLCRQLAPRHAPDAGFPAARVRKQRGWRPRHAEQLQRSGERPAPSRLAASHTSRVLDPLPVSLAAAYQQFWLHRADFLNIQNVLRARVHTRPRGQGQFSL